ncbi:MAG: hypothetical protein LC722_01865, partial [Actinobacteria bacterium]|nr:hypothetical protein [Actinomycetota bacterium]
RTSCVVVITITDGSGGSPSGVSCAVSDSTPAEGQTIKVTGRKWLPRSTVTISFVQDGRRQAQTTARVYDDGRFSKQLTIPQSAHDGPAQIRVEGRDRNNVPRTCTVNITVTSSSSAAGFSPVTPVTPATLALLLGTVGIVVMSRRRRARALAPAGRTR